MPWEAGVCCWFILEKRPGKREAAVTYVTQNQIVWLMSHETSLGQLEGWINKPQ
jgi:hypothetical protein